MKNKEIIGGLPHRRPCFFVFSDTDFPEILWLIPISSKTQKFKHIYQSKIEKYGRCNTIRFGTVLNAEAVFLIQNMCPATQSYIDEIYRDRNQIPIAIDNRIVNDVIKNAREILSLTRRGINLVFPDIQSIYRSLVSQLSHSKDTPDPISF